MDYEVDGGIDLLNQDIRIAAKNVAELERELRIAQKKLAKLENIRLEKTGIFVYKHREVGKSISITDFD